MRHCATCSTAPSRGAIHPKLSGIRARESSGIGEHRAGGSSAPTIWKGLVRSCAQREHESRVCVAAVRLLRLTRCKPGERRCLRWFKVKLDRLILIDAKTGQRYVLLYEAAQELLNGLVGTNSGGNGCSPEMRQRGR